MTDSRAPLSRHDVRAGYGWVMPKYEILKYRCVALRMKLCQMHQLAVEFPRGLKQRFGPNSKLW